MLIRGLYHSYGFDAAKTIQYSRKNRNGASLSVRRMFRNVAAFDDLVLR